MDEAQESVGWDVPERGRQRCVHFAFSAQGEPDLADAENDCQAVTVAPHQAPAREAGAMLLLLS